MTREMAETVMRVAKEASGLGRWVLSIHCSRYQPAGVHISRFEWLQFVEAMDRQFEMLRRHSPRFPFEVVLRDDNDIEYSTVLEEHEAWKISQHPLCASHPFGKSKTPAAATARAE